MVPRPCAEEYVLSPHVLRGVNMSSIGRVRRGSTVETDAADGPNAAGALPATAPYTGWLERMQRARGRHAAITRSFGSIASYRTWADKMKGSFDDEPKK
ncbi:MAG: hypothetical protein WCE48_09955 [Steroidobacteraceae bacterium]